MKIGIDIGGSHIGIGQVDINGKIINKKEIDLEPEKDQDLKKYITQYIINELEHIIQSSDVELIGLAMPGTIENKVLIESINLGIKNFDLAKIIKEKYNIPVNVNNDAKCAAMAEKQFGSLKNYEDCAFLCLGTGIGGAVFLNNKLLKSKNNNGFELGHIIIDKNGPQCNCGKKGCFETFCSIKRFKLKVINSLNLKPNTKSSDLLDIIKKNIHNPEIQNIIQEYIDNLIVGLSNIIDIFEPEAISLGGGFAYFKDVFYTELLEKFKLRNYRYNKDKITDIKIAELGNDAGIIRINNYRTIEGFLYILYVYNIYKKIQMQRQHLD